ncbi:MAG: tetratricopeptide repeat protein [Desulfurivibrio sp.]|nr:tetratricopeptide repeat protein [Desulfurivibrio sp.]
MFRFSVLICALVLLLGAGLATASVDDDPLAAGRQAMEAGDHEAAYDFLFTAFQEHPTDPDVNFLLGRAAFETGRYEEAVMAYERVLLYNPDSGRTKLELARAYVRLGSSEIARQYFREVLATNPPEAVMQNIQRFLAALDAAQKRHFLSGLVTVGVGYDDNVRTSPESSTVSTVLGDVLLTGDSATATSNYLFNTNTVINHVFRAQPNSPHSWRTSVTNYNAFHETANDMDINLFGLSTGPSWRRDKLLVQGGLSYNQINLGFDRYLGALGLNANLTRVLTSNWALNAGAKYQKKDFIQNSEKDSHNLTFNLGPVLSFGKNRLSTTLSHEKERADAEHHSYDRHGVTMRYDRRLPRDFAAFVSLRYQKTDYQAVNPNGLFADKREDKTKKYSLGLSRVLWQSKNSRRSLTGQATHTRTVADSNIDLYEYRKDVSTLAVSFSF